MPLRGMRDVKWWRVVGLAQRKDHLMRCERLGRLALNVSVVSDDLLCIRKLYRKVMSICGEGDGSVQANGHMVGPYFARSLSLSVHTVRVSVLSGGYVVKGFGCSVDMPEAGNIHEQGSPDTSDQEDGLFFSCTQSLRPARLLHVC